MKQLINIRTILEVTEYHADVYYNFQISKHEMAFWGKESDFKKNYLKRVYQKEYDAKYFCMTSNRYYA